MCAYVLCNTVCKKPNSSEIFMRKLTVVCIDPVYSDSAANGLLTFSGREDVLQSILF